MKTDIKNTIKNARRKVYRDLRKLFTPHMYPSGYRTGRVGLDFSKSRPLMLWAPKDERDRVMTIELPGYKLTDFLAFTENGIMTDAAGGGAITESLGCFPLEDLIMLQKWAEQNLPPLQPVARPAQAAASDIAATI